MDEVIKKVKEKKELADVDVSLVEEVVQKYLKKNNLAAVPSDKKNLKIFIKEVRAELRKYTGRFQHAVNYDKRKKLLEENKIDALLKAHTSTKERFNDYGALIDQIKALNPSSILDMGCGLNPIALAKSFLDVKYIAMDIKEDELKLIRSFFKNNNINGVTKVQDIRNVRSLPKTDLCLLFKVLDIIDLKGHAHATEVMKKIKAKHTLVSFSTRTLSGKPMRSPRRQWFENLVRSLDFVFSVRKTSNEIFYLVESIGKREHRSK